MRRRRLGRRALGKLIESQRWLVLTNPYGLRRPIWLERLFHAERAGVVTEAEVDGVLDEVTE